MQKSLECGAAPPLSKKGVKKNLQYIPANFSMKSTVCFSALGCAADAFKRSAKEHLSPVPEGRRGKRA